jgi:HK97 family phage major capsid protein
VLATTDVLADSDVNRFDVLLMAVRQATVAEYVPNAIMIHPNDFFNMLVLKDDNGRYLMPDAVRFGASLPRIAGTPVVANTAITAGDFLVGDFANAAQLFDRQQSTIRFYESDQDNAVKGLVTVTINERVALPIYRPNAIVFGDFASALANGSA